MAFLKVVLFGLSMASLSESRSWLTRIVCELCVFSCLLCAGESLCVSTGLCFVASWTAYFLKLVCVFVCVCTILGSFSCFL